YANPSDRIGVRSLPMRMLMKARRLAPLAAAITLLAGCAGGTASPSAEFTGSLASAAPQVSPAVVAEYQRALDAYQRARAPYDAAAEAYWDQVAAKRSVRFQKRAKGQQVQLSDYVLTQPPVYTGPSRPADPTATP